MLNIGTLIAERYEVVGKIGAGGMSDVYKAKDTKLGRFVAIKVLKAEFSEDRTFVSKFRAEAQSAAGLEHPNIVNIYDVGNENGTYYIVMEYVEGITLKTYIEKKGQLAFKESVSIAIQVARGIEAAHNKEIIHRDIKPQNIIISTEGKVKVTDFGIARAASANTISSDVMGSVHYASPEQARNGYVDMRSDIYSLGIVMFEMITGRVPFDGESTVAVAIQHLQEDMPLPSKYAPEIPISFEGIILKSTQKSPERRYQNMAELMKDLRRSLSEPNENFVVIAPLYDNGKTRVLSENELKAIREAGSKDDSEEKAAAVTVAASGSKAAGIKSAPGKTSVSKSEEVVPSAAGRKPEKKKYEDDDLDDDFDDEDEDEEEDGILSPGLYKIVSIVRIIALIAIIAVIIYLATSIMGLFRFPFGGKNQDTQAETMVTESESETGSEHADQVKMISILGQSQEEAEAALKDLGLSMRIVGYKKAQQAPGSVMDQDVSIGAWVDKGSTVGVILAGEAKNDMVVVPGVVGNAENAAVKALANAGLKASKTFEYDDRIAAGTVISQEPASGVSVEEGATVVLVISQGKKAATVPSVEGKSEENAKSTLESYKLKYDVKTSYSDTVAEGKVISQSPVSGKTVEEGTRITITVSLGKKPQPQPEVKPSEQAPSEQAPSQTPSQTPVEQTPSQSAPAGGESGSNTSSPETDNGGDTPQETVNP